LSLSQPLGQCMQVGVIILWRMLIDTKYIGTFALFSWSGYSISFRPCY
jgi:hypothetical protein